MEKEKLLKYLEGKRKLISIAYNREWHRTYQSKERVAYFKGKLEIIDDIIELIKLDSGDVNEI